jgi:hypothetical protein
MPAPRADEAFEKDAVVKALAATAARSGTHRRGRFYLTAKFAMMAASAKIVGAEN